MSDSPKQSAAYPTSEPDAPPVSTASSKSWKSNIRYGVAGLMFVAIVAAIAWVTQFMPNRRPATKLIDVRGLPAVNGPLQFVNKVPDKDAITVQWDKDDEGYALEQERGKTGHVDFPFENNSGAPAELGLMSVSCDCSSLEVVLPLASEWELHRNELKEKPQADGPQNWNWIKMPKDETEGILVPAGAKGVLRITWHARRENGALLNLAIKIWHQPKGNVNGRGFEDIKLPIRATAMLRFMPAMVSVGTLSAGEFAVAKFTVWSATRDALDITLGDSGNPLFNPELRKFTPQECRDLQNQLNEERNGKRKENTRIRLAYHLTVKVQEQAGGKQLDQGPFNYRLALMVDGDKVAEPSIWGAVKGDIVVGNPEDRGKIDLKIFPAKYGSTQTVYLWTGDQVALKLENQTPPTLDVKLDKLETKGKRAKWKLEVGVPPDTQFGAFSPESVIILRTHNNPPRFIRIPVIGTGNS